MASSKTINNYEKFIQEFRIEKNNDKTNLEQFFKKKFLIVENNKIIYPKISELNKKNIALEEQITNIKKTKEFWEKEKNHAKNYYKNVKINMFLKKKFWKHKIKQILNQEYKEDVLSAKLTDEVLMDPAYETLLDTFLVDYDYRKKLTDTVNKSIIYKEHNIGDHNKKKQIFKEENANKNVEKNHTKIELLEKEIKANKTIAKYIKQINKI